MNEHADLDLLAALAAGDLDDADRERVEAHARTCVACTQTIEAVRATIAEMRALPQPEPTAEQSWALRAQVARARSRSGRIARWSVATAGAAASVVAVVALTLGPGGGADGPRSGASVTSLEAAAPIEILSAEFTSSSASTLLEQPQAFASAAGPPADHSTDRSVELRTGGGGATAEYAADTGQVERCEATIFSSGSPLPRERGFAATWRSGSLRKQAFFLIYRAEDRFELWVVDRTSCDVLYFAERPAR